MPEAQLTGFPSAPRWALVLLALALPALAACGGGGGGTPSVAPGAPATLSYAEPSVVYRTDGPVTPNVPTVTGGTPDLYEVSPNLPAGLTCEPGTGAIHGTPTVPTPMTAYTVTASNAGGQTQAQVQIEVTWVDYKSIEPVTAPSEADLRHFLLRTHWGTDPVHMTPLQAQGLSTYIDQMLVFPPRGSTAWEATAQEILYNGELPAGQEYLFPTRSEVTQWFLDLCLNNPNPFQEVLTYFWHDHFATSSDVLGGGRLYYMREHMELLRSEGNGNLKTLVLGICRDWAMLWWLDGYINRNNNINENFGREYLELFTVGVDNGYTQQDIEELARACTGYQDVVLDSDTGLRHMVFNPSRHDPNDKTIFGFTIPGQNLTDDFDAVVDITFDHLDAAEWFCYNLCKYFLHDDPAPELVDQFADVLRNANWELAPLLKTMFLSEAFYSSKSREGFVKGPLEFAIGFSNTLDLPIISTSANQGVRHRALENALSSMGNIPTRPPTVNGWPGGSQWLSAQDMVNRANLLRTVIINREPQELAGIDVADLLPPALPAPPNAAAPVVDEIALRMGVTLSPTERQSLITYLDTAVSGDTLSLDPFDPTNATHLDERLRGLLYILGQHPTYMVR